MVNIGNILKRAWHILWNYKLLWIFGLLLAFTAGGTGGSNFSYQFGRRDVQNWEQRDPSQVQVGPAWDDFRSFVEQEIVPLLEYPREHIATFIWIGVALFLFILIISVIFAFVRYVSETALLRMVDDYEQTGTKVSFKQGWKLGWSRRAFRMWVIDLIINLPGFLFLILMISLGVLFFYSVVEGEARLAAAGAITAIGCSFIFLFAFSLLMVLLGLLRQFFVRSAALEETRVGDSFRRGWAMFKRNWQSAALMWLVMLGIGIAFGFASMILMILLIPVFLVMLIPALLVAAIPGLIAFGIASLFTHWVLAAIIGVIIALPFFFTVLFVPFSLITGWYRIYESSVWTLTYREMKALEALQPAAQAEPPAVSA